MCIWMEATLTRSAVLAIFKYGRYSWRPWLISMIVESASQAAITRSFTSPYGSTKSTMTALEKAELSRRFNQMWYNVLRGQFYERYTRYVFTNNYDCVDWFQNDY